MAPAARPLKRRPSSSARVAGRCWTSVSGASLNFHAHRHLFAARFGGLERAEMIHGPIGKHCAAVNKLTGNGTRSEEHTSELQSRLHLVCRLLLEKKKNTKIDSMRCWCVVQLQKCLSSVKQSVYSVMHTNVPLPLPDLTWLD